MEQIKTMKRRDFLKLLTMCFLTLEVKPSGNQKKPEKIDGAKKAVNETPNVFMWLRKN